MLLRLYSSVPAILIESAAPLSLLAIALVVIRGARIALPMGSSNRADRARLRIAIQIFDLLYTAFCVSAHGHLRHKTKPEANAVYLSGTLPTDDYLPGYYRYLME